MNNIPISAFFAHNFGILFCADNVPAVLYSYSNRTVAFNKAARAKYLDQCHARMTVWQAIEKLDTLVDQSGKQFERFPQAVM